MGGMKLQIFCLIIQIMQGKEKKSKVISKQTHIQTDTYATYKYLFMN